MKNISEEFILGSTVAGFSIVLIIITFAILFGILALVIAGQCKIFIIAGQPGWTAIIPIYNIYVMLKIIKMEWWHLLIIIGFEIISGLDISVAMYIVTIGILVY